jgi:hypothetical protein
MNWEAIGAIGELFGALAVVLTLIYLATQVRQNTLAMRVAAKQEITRQLPANLCGIYRKPLGRRG